MNYEMQNKNIWNKNNSWTFLKVHPYVRSPVLPLRGNLAYGTLYKYLLAAYLSVPTLTVKPLLWYRLYQKPFKIVPYVGSLFASKLLDKVNMGAYNFLQNFHVRANNAPAIFEKHMLRKFGSNLRIQYVPVGGGFDPITCTLCYPKGNVGILAHELGHCQQYSNYCYRNFVSPLILLSRGARVTAILPLIAKNENVAKDYAQLSNIFLLPMIIEEIGKFFFHHNLCLHQL